LWDRFDPWRQRLRCRCPTAGVALRLFLDPSIRSLLSTSVAREQWDELLDILEPKLTRTTDRNLLAAVREFAGSADQLRQDTVIKLATATSNP